MQWGDVMEFRDGFILISMSCLSILLDVGMGTDRLLVECFSTIMKSIVFTRR